MVTVKKLKFLMAAGLILVTLTLNPLQAERSPIFGSASIQALSVEAAQDITARGFWADHFGAIAVSLSYNAYIYAYYARYFAGSNTANETNWYWAASNNAYWAYIHAYYAAVYSAAGI